VSLARAPSGRTVEGTPHRRGAQQGPRPRPAEEAVVDHAVGHRGVVVGQQERQPRGRRGPGDVVPEHAGAIALDELAHLRLGVVAVAATRKCEEQVGERADPMLVPPRVEAAGVVDAEAHPRPAHRLGKLADDVAAAEPLGPVGVLYRRRPEAVPVVVLRDEDDIARPGRGEARSPLVRIPCREPGFPVARERVVGTIAVRRSVMAGGRAAREAKRVLVPLGVGRMSERTGVARRDQLCDLCSRRREPRHRRRRPVHEDAELRVAPPVGRAVAAHDAGGVASLGSRAHGAPSPASARAARIARATMVSVGP
jgi:hypothetical protein